MSETIDLSEDELEFIQAMRNGRSVIINCNFGFGVEVTESEDGRARIGVTQDPQPDIGPALHNFVVETVRNWTASLRDKGYG